LPSFLANRRGSGEAISFIFVLAVLLLVVLNMLPPALDVIRYLNLTRVHRETLLRMEIAGGLTPDIEQRAIQSLIDLGFDSNGITITGTPAVANYGDTVELQIRYTYTYRDYAFRHFLIYPEDRLRTMVVDGATVSFAFQK